jgi:hypothetical protein
MSRKGPTRICHPRRLGRARHDSSTTRARIPEFLSTLDWKVREMGRAISAIWLFQGRFFAVIVKPRRPIFGVP